MTGVQAVSGFLNTVQSAASTIRPVVVDAEHGAERCAHRAHLCAPSLRLDGYDSLKLKIASWAVQAGETVTSPVEEDG